MKLNPQSKRYLQHFKYLQSSQAESITSAYTFHPNVLKNLKKSKKTSTNGVNVSKNLGLYMKKNNIVVHYMNIYNTDLKVLSTNTSTKVLKNASFIIYMQLDNTPCTLMLYFGNTYFFGNCNTSHNVNTAQFQMGGVYSTGAEKIHENMHFFQQSTEETKSIVEFLKELEQKELQEEDLFMYSTVIDNPELYKNAYNLTKHVQELISTNKKIHHLMTYIANYA